MAIKYFLMAAENGQTESLEFLKSITGAPNAASLRDSPEFHKIERILKEEEQDQIQRESHANLKKAAGNKEFAKKNYPAALSLYSDAITLNPENHILYSNRAAALLELQNFA